MIDNKGNMRYLNILILTFAVFALESCSNDKFDPVIIGDGALSDNEIEIKPTGSSFSIAYTSNKAWSILSCPSWLEPEVDKGGPGTTVIQFSAELNKTREDRSDIVVIGAADGSFKTEISVRQPFPYLKIESEDVKDFMVDHLFDYSESKNQGGISYRLPIKSNVIWRIEVEEDSGQSEFYGLEYFSLTSLGGENDCDFEISPANQNFGKEPYSVVFNIIPKMLNENNEEEDIPEEAADRYTVALTQDNFLFLLNGSPDPVNIAINDMNSNTPFLMEVEAESPWTISECPEWIVTNAESGQNTTFNIAADGISPTRDDRAGVIKLLAEEGAVVREINVRQDGYMFYLDFEDNPDENNDIRISSEDTGEHFVILHTRGPWEIKNIPEWLRVSPASCDEAGSTTEHVIKFNMARENLEFEDLVANLEFSRKMKPAGMREDPVDTTVNVIHNKFIFDLIPSPVLGRIPTMNTLQYPIEVKCSGGWEIESVPDWLAISEMEGSRDGTVLVNAKTPNPDEEQDRSADISFVSVKHRVAGETVTRKVSILQRKYTFEFSGDALEHIPAYKSEFPAYYASLQCSSAWELVEYPDWLTPDITSGDGMEDVDIRFIPDINADGVSREGALKIKDTYTGNEVSAIARQDAFVFDSSDHIIEDIDVMNTVSYTVSFDMTAEAPWELAECPEWAGPSAASGEGASAGKTAVVFTPDPNPELSERSGTAVIRSLVNNEEIHVSLVQDPYVFDSTRESFSFKEIPSGSVQLPVECSGPWTVSAPGWVQFSPSHGESSQDIAISVDKNVEMSDRSASCILTSTLNGLTREISISQDAFEFDLTSHDYSFSALDDNEKRFNVRCSGAWSIDNVPGWIVLSKKEGPGDVDGSSESIDISVKENLDLYSRESTISVVSKDNPQLKKVINVFQEKFIFDVSETSCKFAALSKDIDPVKVNVDCSGDWTVSTASAWIRLSSITDTGFELSVSQNNEKESRSGTVQVKSSMNNKSIEIAVTQDGN